MRLRVRPDQDARVTPATGLSHVDVTEYLNWINKATGGQFRLPTTGEWADMARPVLPEEADPLFTDPSLTWASAYLTESLPPAHWNPKAVSRHPPTASLISTAASGSGRGTAILAHRAMTIPRAALPISSAASTSPPCPTLSATPPVADVLSDHLPHIWECVS